MGQEGREQGGRAENHPVPSPVGQGREGLLSTAPSAPWGPIKGSDRHRAGWEAPATVASEAGGGCVRLSGAEGSRFSLCLGPCPLLST